MDKDIEIKNVSIINIASANLFSNFIWKDLNRIQPILVHTNLKTRKIKLSTLAIRLDISVETLIRLLNKKKNNNKKVHHESYLNEDQIQSILFHYKKTIKKVFNKSSKNLLINSEKEKLDLFEFFSYFISEPQRYDADSIYSTDLEDRLIENFFNDIIYSSGNVIAYEFSSHYKKCFNKLIENVKSIFSGVSNSIISIFIHHYYCFSIEEDSKRRCY